MRPERRGRSLPAAALVVAVGLLLGGCAAVAEGRSPGASAPGTAPSGGQASPNESGSSTAPISSGAGGISVVASSGPHTIPTVPRGCLAVVWTANGGFRCDLPDAAFGFEVGRAQLDAAAARTALLPLCTLLTAPGSPWRVVIVGHTSPEGDTPEGHQRLSEARALAARAFLLDCGVADERITATGVGATRPTTGVPHPLADDRRVTVELVPVGGGVGAP